MGYFLAGGNRNSWVKQVCFIGGYYTVVKHGYYQFKDFCCKKRGQVFIQVIGIFFVTYQSYQPPWNCMVWFNIEAWLFMFAHTGCVAVVYQAGECTPTTVRWRWVWWEPWWKSRIWKTWDARWSSQKGFGWSALGPWAWRVPLEHGHCHVHVMFQVPWIFSSLRGCPWEDWNGASHWVPWREVDKSGIGLGFQNGLQLFQNHFSNLQTSKLLSPVVCNYWRQVPKLSKEATMYPTHLHTLRDFTLSMAFKCTILCFIFNASTCHTSWRTYMHTCRHA